MNLSDGTLSSIPDRTRGQEALSDTIFRISTMGNLTSVDIDRLVQCFSEAIPKVRSAAAM